MRTCVKILYVIALFLARPSFAQAQRSFDLDGIAPRANFSSSTGARNQATTSTPVQVRAAIPLTSTAPVAVVPSAAAIPQPAAVAPEDYVLSPGDIVEVKVFQEDDLDTIARISQDGVIVFPLIGRVSIGGQTPQNAARLIQELLGKDYLVNPHVNVNVNEYTKRRITVLGEVQKPGSYDLPDRVTIPLLEAIGMAGGYTRVADPSRITVKRKVNDRISVMRLNAKKMAGSSTASFEVLPGDIINVGESLF